MERAILLTATLALVGGASAQSSVSANNCTIYAAPCEGFSLAQSESCCFYPAVFCLPDIFNGTSCISPLDPVNLSPSLTASLLFQPFLDGLQNATAAIFDLVQINGTTVLNRTEIITPSTTIIYNG